MNPYVEEVTKLRARLEELECENHFLRETLKPQDNRFRSLGITRNEGRILHLIYDASPRAVTNEQLHESVSHRRELNWPDNNLKVYIWKIRQKLKPLGVSVHCQYGVGYFITRQDAEALARIIAAEDSE